MQILKRSLIIATLLFMGIAQANESERTTYRLSFEDDLSISLAALGITGLGTFLYYRMDTPETIKDKDNLLPWDRPQAGRYSKNADLASDFGAVLALAPFAVGGIALYNGNSNGSEFTTFTVMFAQSILIGNGINLAVRSLEVWPRPYMYAEWGEGIEQAEKADAEAYGSLFSGHATTAFTVATFTDQWFRTVYPNSPYKGLVRAGAYSLATLESVLRIAAGKHYVTDVLVGALVGTGVSLGILEMHKDRNEKLSVWVGPGVAGITLRI